MAITWIDGFDLYSATVPMAARGYILSGTVSLVAGRFGEQAIRISTSNSVNLPLQASMNVISFGLAMNLGATAVSGAGAGQALMHLRLNGSTIVRIGVDNTGRLLVGRGDFGANLISASSAGVITVGSYKYWEFEITRHASAGIVNAWVDGVPVIADTGKNTGASDFNQFFMQVQTASTYDADDWWITDTTRLGERFVDVLRPVSDSAQNDWSASSGSNNASLVDDTTANDTDYVFSNTVGQIDRYNIEDLPTNPTAISAIQITYAALKDDATTRTIRPSLKSGGTTSPGATKAVSPTYQWFTDIRTVDPNTSAPWTFGGVNAIEVGPEIVS
jgi:hypothetical protein